MCVHVALIDMKCLFYMVVRMQTYTSDVGNKPDNVGTTV